MKIISAIPGYEEAISKMMLADLEMPNPKFPAEIIAQFRVHAQEENVAEELKNPNLIAFLSTKNNKLQGFIVGYKESRHTAVIHYVAGNIASKKLLIDRFLQECKKKKIMHIKADTFEFMENNKFFIDAGFILFKKEKMAKDLETLWYIYSFEEKRSQ